MILTAHFWPYETSSLLCLRNVIMNITWVNYELAHENAVKLLKTQSTSFLCTTEGQSRDRFTWSQARDAGTANI